MGLLHDQRGAAAPEYAVLLVAVVIVAAGAFKTLGSAAGAAAHDADRVLSSEDVAPRRNSLSARASAAATPPSTVASPIGVASLKQAPVGAGVVGSAMPRSFGTEAGHFGGSATFVSSAAAPHFTSALFTTNASAHQARSFHAATSSSHVAPAHAQAAPAAGHTISAHGEAQMAALEQEAESSAAGNRPEGRCYASVAKYIDTVGYGDMHQLPVSQRGQLPAIPSAYGSYAHQFADYMNKKDARGETNADRLGLQRLPITNPYKAPPGSIVVVRAGTPGTANPIAGDIVVVGKNGTFYNDGNMGYGGPQNFGPGNSYVLGVYAPK